MRSSYLFDLRTNLRTIERHALIALCWLRANRLEPQRSESMLLNSRSTNAPSCDSFVGNRAQIYRKPDELIDQQIYPLHSRFKTDATEYAVEISPPDIVRRRTMTMEGLTAEVVQATRREKIEFRFRAPLHLLTIYDQGSRNEGET